MENIWDLRKNQLCFSNASRSHPARHCWVFLCCIASFSSVSDTPKQGEAPEWMPLVIITRTRAVIK